MSTDLFQKIDMKKLVLLFLLLPFLFCVKIKIGPWPSPVCTSDSTSISIQVVDFYSGQVLPSVPIQIYDQGFLSIYGWILLEELYSDTSGLASFQFLHDSLSAYSLKVLPSPDTTHIYPWQVKISPGCANDWKILMKPTQYLTLHLKNDGSVPYGKSYMSVTRQHKNYSSYQNDDIVGYFGYSFGLFQIDTVPIGFEKEFLFKVIPEEELEIQFGDGKFRKIEKLHTSNETSISFLFSI